MASFRDLTVRRMPQPPWLNDDEWAELLDQVGDLVIGRIVKVAGTPGDGRIFYELDEGAKARIVKTIKQILGVDDQPWEQDADWWK